MRLGCDHLRQRSVIFAEQMNTALRTIVLAVLALLPTLIAGLAIR